MKRWPFQPFSVHFRFSSNTGRLQTDEMAVNWKSKWIFSLSLLSVYLCLVPLHTLVCIVSISMHTTATSRLAIREGVWDGANVRYYDRWMRKWNCYLVDGVYICLTSYNLVTNCICVKGEVGKKGGAGQAHPAATTPNRVNREYTDTNYMGNYKKWSSNSIYAIH